MRCAAYSLAAIVVLAGGTRAEDKPVVVKLIKFSAPAPADWKSEKPSNRLRTYQFKLPGAKDHPEAELSIMNESLPGTDKNFPKWKATFVPPEGKTVDDISKTAKWEVPGATVNVLDVTGTWKYKERPLDKKETLLEDWRVIWVIVEEKDTDGTTLAHHIRLSGPSVTVAEHAKALEKWVKSLR
ncbi:hypothetical protein VT84_15820 [Gemmata sp. SH-PL17]|uniref:hypothetical protein n=1 Tax=Gemmata sp. SH-PL17 TaxID=1630693 RepID=UPI00078D4BC3|nr:hypothetical protein [Gemmata sp. SH-PL17]AMV25866.1 hypothetical protein VT84_15820 [Gemmata sp. SH-PL17]